MLALEYFVGGLPAGTLFKLSFDELNNIVDISKDDKDIFGLNPTAEVCLIGLVSYFEAFCKNKFASLINICPALLNNFIKKRPDININVNDLLILDSYSKNMIGFLLAEKFDFGSAKTINNIFFDLLQITLFSNDEAKDYNHLLIDRNLIVHNAGIYTLKYHRHRIVKKRTRHRAFYDSLIIKKRDFKKWAAFIEKLVIKFINISYKALKDFTQNEKIKLSKENKKALEYLKWYE